MAGLFHDAKYHSWGERAQEGRQRSQADVRDAVLDVVVSDVVKVKVTIVADEPALEGVQELGKRWVDVEEILPPQIIGRAAERHL